VLSVIPKDPEYLIAASTVSASHESHHALAIVTNFKPKNSPSPDSDYSNPKTTPYLQELPCRQKEFNGGNTDFWDAEIRSECVSTINYGSSNGCSFVRYFFNLMGFCVKRFCLENKLDVVRTAYLSKFNDAILYLTETVEAQQH